MSYESERKVMLQVSNMTLKTVRLPDGRVLRPGNCTEIEAEVVGQEDEWIAIVVSDMTGNLYYIHNNGEKVSLSPIDAQRFSTSTEAWAAVNEARSRGVICTASNPLYGIRRVSE